MLILGIDFETTGLDTQKDDVIEMGAVLYDTERKAPIKIISELIAINRDIPASITDLTGIRQDDIEKFGVSFNHAVSSLVPLIIECDYFLAHNKDFDKAFLDRKMLEIEQSRGETFRIERDYLPHYKDKVWLDTMIDIQYPKGIGTHKLTYLAAEHCFVNPFSHRAVFDVLTAIKIAEHYSWDKIVERAKVPNVRVIAKVSYDDRQLAKDAGYHWDKAAQVWFKTMKACDLELERQRCKFQIVGA